MPVVAGHGADELHRLPDVDRALEQGVDQGVVHDGQARVVAGHQLPDRHVEQLGEDLPDLGQARRATVVAAVGPRCVAEVSLAGQAEERVGQVELLRRRLAPRQVQLETGVHELRVRRGHLGVQLVQFFAAEFGQGHGSSLLGLPGTVSRTQSIDPAAWGSPLSGRRIDGLPAAAGQGN
jgi:hypothetical protein